MGFELMTTITFKNQYSNYNSPSVNKAASPSEVAAINPPIDEKTSDVKGINSAPKEQSFLEKPKKRLFISV